MIIFFSLFLLFLFCFQIKWKGGTFQIITTPKTPKIINIHPAAIAKHLIILSYFLSFFLSYFLSYF